MNGLIKLYEMEDGEPTGPFWGIYEENFHDLDDFAVAVAQECCCDWEMTELEIEDYEDEGNYDKNDEPLPHLLNHIKSKTVKRWFKVTDDDILKPSASFVLGAFPATCYIHNQ